MKISNKASVQVTLQLFKSKGIKHIVIAPGSRNAPLNISFNEDHFFTCYSIVDERSAAFFAMGMAQQLKAPVAVVCTSGSAVLNFYPAVAEAFYQKYPLIVLSADRPDEWIDQADGQTIRQKGVLDLHVHKSTHISNADAPRFIARKLNEVLNAALSESMPIHINMAFEEPLYELVEASAAIQPKNIEVISTITSLAPEVLENLKQEISPFKKVLILSGSNDPNTALDQVLSQHIAHSHWVLLTETTSNINVSEQIPCLDKMIFHLEEEHLHNLQPDLLITFGGSVVSKKVKQWLRTQDTLSHWHIAETKEHLDTFLHLDKVIYARPQDFFSEMTQFAGQEQQAFKKDWFDYYQVKKDKAAVALKELPFCDLWVYKTLFQHLPEAYLLQLGNSSVVRYAQLFEHQKQNAHYANRGTSGIDGSLSTAVGAAVASRQGVLCVIGDLSFFYDSNALWNNYIPSNFKVLLVNNGGGDIFNIIPGPQVFDKKDAFFVAQHQLRAEHHAKAFGLSYLYAADQKTFEQQIKSFFETEEPVILEVNTQAIENSAYLKAYWQSLRI